MKIFTLPKFVRRFVRKHTEQIPIPQALSTRKKLSILYTIITWNLLGYIIYKIIKDKDLIKKEPGEKRWWEGKVFKMNKPEDIKTYRFQGFNLVEVKKAENSTSETDENLK